MKILPINNLILRRINVANLFILILLIGIFPIRLSAQNIRISSIENLMNYSCNELGTTVSVESYYAGRNEGGGLYRLTSIHESNAIGNQGTIIQGVNGRIWKLVQDSPPFITQFGVKMNENNPSNTKLIQNALDNVKTVIIPEGECYYNGTLYINFRQSLQGVSKNSVLVCVLPTNSSSSGMVLAGGVSIKNITLQLNCDFYQGDFLQWNSEFISKQYSLSGKGITHTRNMDVDILNVFIYKPRGENKKNDYTGTAIKWLHTGKGKALYGALFQNINIAGDFEYAIDISVEQHYTEEDSGIRIPWFTGQTYKNILINKCKNGVRIGTKNLTKSKKFAPLPPSYFVFDAVQQQVEKKVSQRMFHITNGKNIFIVNCRAWDWHRAALGYERKPYRISNYSNKKADTKNINFLNSTTTGSSIVFDDDMPPLAYNSRIGTSSTAYGGQMNLELIKASGATGKYTYRDLLELPAGVYGSVGENDIAKKLNLFVNPYDESAKDVIMLEVINSFQNRKYFKVYRSSMKGTGKVFNKSQFSVFYGAMGTSNRSSREYLSQEIEVEFWRDSEGDSPNDLRFAKTTERSPNPKSGFMYFDVTLNKLLIWDSKKWVDAFGRQSIGTKMDYNRISNKPKGFKFYDMEKGMVLENSTN